MKINKLQLVNFRNYDHCSVAFDKMVTVFYGKNGQGKTNILESIFYSAFGLSHRTNKEDEMVKFFESENINQIDASEYIKNKLKENEAIPSI